MTRSYMMSESFIALEGSSLVIILCGFRVTTFTFQIVIWSIMTMFSVALNIQSVIHSTVKILTTKTMS